MPSYNEPDVSDKPSFVKNQPEDDAGPDGLRRPLVRTSPGEPAVGRRGPGEDRRAAQVDRRVEEHLPRLHQRQRLPAGRAPDLAQQGRQLRAVDAAAAGGPRPGGEARRQGQRLDLQRRHPRDDPQAGGRQASRARRSRSTGSRSSATSPTRAARSGAWWCTRPTTPSAPRRTRLAGHPGRSVEVDRVPLGRARALRRPQRPVGAGEPGRGPDARGAADQAARDLRAGRGLRRRECIVTGYDDYWDETGATRAAGRRAGAAARAPAA